MIRGRARLLGGLAAMALVVAPGVAGAATVTVNSTADTVADTGTCTLREAITAANGNAASGVQAGECLAGDPGPTTDTIGFSASFDGQAADTITLGSALPAITTSTDIAGGHCTTAGVSGPCAGIDGPAASPALVIDGVDNTAVGGIAVTGAKTGIQLKNGAEGFSATNNWLGVKLDGTAGANGTGLLVGPVSDHAQIGDGTVAGRNVFGFNSEVGLDIEAADENTVQGDYFGVKPDGTTSAPGPVDIEITGTDSGQDATGNVVGGTLTSGEAATPACDGPCNVVSAATSAGIDLNGDLPLQHELAAGETTVSGNQIGFGANGVAELPSKVGVKMGAADDVTVGGPSALEANHVVVGEDGIASGDSARNQLVQHNMVGLNYGGTALQATPVLDGGHGIMLAAYGGDATVLDNRVAGPQTMDDPIETLGGPALISRNLIGIGTGGQSLTGGDTGIDVVVGAPGSGTTVTDNFVQNSSRFGIELQGARGAAVTGNTILASGLAGIWVHTAGGGATASADDLIGGDTAADENVISGNNGAAIELDESSNVRIAVARNRGSGNTGPFIDLGADGPGNSPSGPNGGIQAPVIDSVRQGSASGAALPGATVMAFSKATPASGEIAGFLGSAVADSSGSWQIDFAPPIAGGASVGITQTTDAEGTSEVAAGGTPADPLPLPDTDPPETTITQGPHDKSDRHWAKFRFGSDEAGSTFLCRLDAGPFKPCRSPRLYRHLVPGRHVFRVKALDAAGNADPSGAWRRFTVLP